MHVLLALLIAGLVSYVIYRLYFLPQPPARASSAGRSDRALAFLSNGFLFYRERGGEVKQLHSTYAQEALDRRENSREKNSWKKDTAFGIAAGGRMRSMELPDKPLLATSACYEATGNLLYFLKDDAVGGLFRREATSGNEIRVLLRQKLHLVDLNVSPDGAMLAASSQQTGGVANITLMKSDGDGMREVTGGDTVDSSPSWIPGVDKRLLFQSCGLARSDEGYIVAQGNASIQMLNMESGKVEPVLENAHFDYLKPRVDPAGNLLFIRRPFELPRYGAQKMFLDALLLPFRLLRALFHYLNFFSLMYTRKPLTSASGPATQADMKNILLQGRRIDAEKAVRSARSVHGVPSLVPDSWELISRTRQGDERVLATNVASYDVSADGSIIYSNGRGVFVLEPDGTARLELRDEFIGDVVAG
ncbi:MAG TPA: hypothetical protein VLI46_12040 [Ramlibacter sp.]|nr:hypothetical protein [Ramlibacter sp.]